MKVHQIGRVSFVGVDACGVLVLVLIAKVVLVLVVLLLNGDDD
jgi:hypothetical protein